MGSIPGLGRSPWRKAWQSTPVFLPGNPKDRGAWWATVHRVAKSQTRLKQLSMQTERKKKTEWVAPEKSIFLSYQLAASSLMKTQYPNSWQRYDGQFYWAHILAWRIPGMAEPGELPSLGSHRVGHDWSDLAAAAAYKALYIHTYDVSLHPQTTLGRTVIVTILWITEWSWET